MSAPGTGAVATVLVLDMANVIGSVPDGWWRDRAGAAQRLLTGLAPLTGSTVTGPDGDAVRLVRIVAVLEGRANLADRPATRPADRPAAGPADRPTSGRGDSDSSPNGRLDVVRAAGSGDDAIADLAAELVAAGDQVLVVTADRGLRARLPALTAITGPGWLNGLLGRA